MAEAGEVIRERAGDKRTARVATATEARLRSAIAAHDAGAGVLLATRTPRGAPVRVPFDATGDAVVKVREARSLKAKLEGAVVGSRGERAFAAGLGLRASGVAVAEPLASIVDRERDVLVVRFVAGRTLWDALVAAPDREATAALLRRAGRLAARLHTSGATHGDWKPQNVIVPPPDEAELVLLDLEQVRFDAARSVRRVARDLAALDAYGQRLPQPLDVRARKLAFDEYLEARRNCGGPPIEPDVAKALLRETLDRSLEKRARWRQAGIA